MSGDYQEEKGKKKAESVQRVLSLGGRVFHTTNLASCMTQFEIAHVTSYEDICVNKAAFSSANSN